MKDQKSGGNNWEFLFNLIVPLAFFYTTLKTLENLWFPNVFRGYKKRIFVWNWLINWRFREPFKKQNILHIWKQYIMEVIILTCSSKRSFKQLWASDVIEVILMPLLLILNRFQTLFWCFHCWFWTSMCWLIQLRFKLYGWFDNGYIHIKALL